MSGKVISLGGGGRPSGEPVAAVVAKLEEMFESARRGEIVGICAAWVDGGNAAWHVVTPGEASSNTLACAVFDLQFAVAQARYEQ